RRTFLSLAALSLAALQFSLPVSSPAVDPEQFEGRAPSVQELEPSVQAAFPRQSYTPGAAARLVFFNRASSVTVQIFRSGPEGPPIAVVLPTLTWQAYNLRDDNGDGKGDSWYADWSQHTVRLGRPFLSRGVPYNFRVYDLPFLHWLGWYHHDVDVLSDADLQSAPTGDALRRALPLVVFPGHHEYVTAH